MIEQDVKPSLFPAFDRAIEWCEHHPKWQRICDIEDSDALMLQWHEIPRRDRKAWIERYGDSAEDAWLEYSYYRPTRHRYGVIGDDGQFYSSILDVPRLMNSMMVYETLGKPGVYYRGGMHEPSSRAKVN